MAWLKRCSEEASAKHLKIRENALVKRLIAACICNAVAKKGFIEKMQNSYRTWIYNSKGVIKWQMK